MWRLSRRIKTLAVALCSLLLVAFLRERAHPGTTPLSGLSARLSGPASGSEALVRSAAPHVDWSRFAYVQYATNLPYLCSSLMAFERLDALGCRAQRLLLHPREWPAHGDAPEARLLQAARRRYGVRLQPVTVQTRDLGDPTWADSYTKLLALNQTQFDRVLSLDSDSTVLQCLDELFLLPPAPVAMPRCYWRWRDRHELSSQLMLVQPGAAEFRRVAEAIEGAGARKYDMDIMNELYMDSAMVLPHREYDVITGEFKSRTRERDHSAFLGNSFEAWDPLAALHRAKFLHFSDWPIPKPWMPISGEILAERGPLCFGDDCTEREIWYRIYGDFKRRRMEVCGIPNWGGSIEAATLP